MKKRLLSGILALMLLTTLAVPALAAPPDNLTWDGKPATLSDIARYTGYDMVDAKGNYKPLYTYYATELWNRGLFLGSNGSFNLDNPLTRAEGVVMTLRILGKATEAEVTTVPITFTDVPDWARPYVAYAAQNGIASGYNATTFGANDAMTAAQFLTFVLRAMGYKEGEDFIWNKAYDKALAIGLIGAPCHDQYSRSNLFLRDNAAVICYNALFKAPTKTGETLADTISMPGKPNGNVPYATAAEKVVAEGGVKEEPEEEAPPVTSVDYDAFGVAQYESVDASATRKTVKEESNLLFLAYSDSAFKSSDYIELLRGAGFYKQGTISFEAQRVNSVTGGITSVGTKAWECYWYSNNDVQVVFGKVGDAFIVRIYMGEVDTFSANGIRSFYKIIKS